MLRARLAKLTLMAIAISCDGRDAASDSAAAITPIDSVSRAAGDSAVAGREPSTSPTDTARQASVPGGARAGRAAGSAPPVSRDTIRGIISVVGADPRVWVRMQTLSRGTMQFTGPHERTLAGLSGAEVWVVGRVVTSDFNTTTFTVTEFAVRSVDGLPAVDGVLTDRNGSFSISVPGSAPVALRSAPDALRAHVGKRVWVTLSSGDVQSFGVIDN